MAGSCEGVSSSTEEASPSPFSQEGCHTGKRKAKICLKISQRYQPANYLPGKPSLLGRVSELCLKNTLIWSNPAKKVLIAQKKRNKKGVSFWQKRKQSAKCVVMVLVWFGWLVLRGWVGGWPPWLQTSAPCLTPPERELPGPQLATGASTQDEPRLLIGRARELWRLSTNQSGSL